MTITLLLCHFASPKYAVEPALSSFKRYFPEARVVLYTDNESYAYPPGVEEVRVVESPFDKSHKRYGWRSSDLFRAEGMLECDTDIAFYSDSDMFYCSDDVRTILPLVDRFGLCIPANPRLLVRTDALMGTDSDKHLDETKGYSFAYNTSPIIFNTRSDAARKSLESYRDSMRQSPTRSTLAFYRAFHETGFMPCLLPFQWCVCKESIDIGDEVALHVGHREVREFYLRKGPMWLKKLKLARWTLKRMFRPSSDMRRTVRKWSGDV